MGYGTRAPLKLSVVTPPGDLTRDRRTERADAVTLQRLGPKNRLPWSAHSSTRRFGPGWARLPATAAASTLGLPWIFAAGTVAFGHFLEK
jgi:hypothetical protein